MRSYNPARTKGICPKLQSKWEWPYKNFKKINDVFYKVNRNSKSIKADDPVHLHPCTRLITSLSIEKVMFI